MNFYSHVEKREEKIDLEKSILLKKHLREVGEKAEKYFFFEGGDFKRIGYYAGITHDFGKYTTYFQKRLLEIQDFGKLSDHGYISSLYSAFVFKKNINQTINIEDILKEFLPFISFFVIYHHHLDLSSPSKLKFNLEDLSKREILLKQVEDMKNNSVIIDRELRELNLPTVEEFEQNLDNTIDFLKKKLYQFDNKLEEEEKEKVAIFSLALFSSLIDADKKSAGKIKDIDRREIPENIVETYKLESFKEKDYINELREEIFQKVIKKIDNIDIKNQKIFTFTSPTGSGKTLTGFAFALKLRKKIEREFGYTPRIIYSLPFISIINQNYNVIKNVLAKIKDFEGNSSSYIISHHYLSKIEYEEGDELREVDESLALIESWESEVIVTTFVQLLHTIIGFKNNFLKKYHNIARSIIILDEVQNIPAEYWKLVERIFKLMCKYLNCYIILMTATKPLIFSSNEALELLDDNESYYEKLNRIKLFSYVKEERNLDSLLSLFVDFYTSQKSYMIVLNTIKSSIEFYNILKKQNLSPLYYLSANIIPKERLIRIDRIKEDLNKGFKPVLVSTQVVEAGVDIDFDVVIRDIGPLDSVIQASGRCNRNFQRNTGEVYVVFLKDEKGKSYANMVYKKLTPRITFETLINFDEIKESEFIKIINNYFEKLRFEKSQEESDFILSALRDLRFYEPKEIISVNSFKLIEEKGVIYPVFIEIDNSAKNIWKNFKSIILDDSLERWEKKIKLLGIKSDLEGYIVNVRVEKDASWIFDITFDQNIGYVPFHKISEYYDHETGFKKNELSSVIFG
ncbi:MAG: CRISPR-associated helicase Cas3' [Dictyoglomaceae bacterium]|nr:CRISPR-associated helicase Cas3' [Dictyoglomaceae bacterium]